MELHQLRYFAAVVDEGTFTAAASRLHVSQSGVSTQVAKLERELGQRLVERTGRRVRLTAAGEAVLPQARAALAAVDGIEQTAAEFAAVVRGRVRLGMIRGCAIPGFLDAVADLGRTHPGLAVSLHEADSRELCAGILDRSLDLALIAFAGEPDPELDVTIVLDEPIAAVTGPGHGPEGPTVRLADLARERVLCLPSGTGIRAAWDRSCREAGVAPRVDIEASAPGTLLGLAARGAGVAVLSRSAAAGSGLRVLPVPDATVPARLGLATRPRRLPRATRVVLHRVHTGLTADTAPPARRPVPSPA
ncbi:LysR family transcriptional regulator (plasmid) [Streptomyces sp. BI20]|uniref:LysR family transcriptional regulator n=1 Tax=Streptomyces sp. BI20 TaxID=3403460 RepID=UPI003C7353F2